MQQNPITNSSLPIIALGEGWAYFMGRFLADKKYQMVSSNAIEQHREFKNNDPLAGFSSHLNVLENFDPNRTVDEFRWIPQGLFEDMIDETNEKRLTGGAVDDNISGYTIIMMINALESNVKSPQQFRDRLIQQTGSSQALINLFNEYHYN